MKISYHKRFDKNGTVYNQAVRISQKQFEMLKRAVDAERAYNYPRKKEYVFTSGGELFLHPFYKNTFHVFYLNHTQLRFCNLFLKLNLKDRNTCFLIDKKL